MSEDLNFSTELNATAVPNCKTACKPTLKHLFLPIQNHLHQGPDGISLCSRPAKKRPDRVARGQIVAPTLSIKPKKHLRDIVLLSRFSNKGQVQDAAAFPNTKQHLTTAKGIPMSRARTVRQRFRQFNWAPAWQSRLAPPGDDIIGPRAFG